MTQEKEKKVVSGSIVATNNGVGRSIIRNEARQRQELGLVPMPLQRNTGNRMRLGTVTRTYSVNHLWQFNIKFRRCLAVLDLYEDPARPGKPIYELKPETTNKDIYEIAAHMGYIWDREAVIWRSNASGSFLIAENHVVRRKAFSDVREKPQLDNILLTIKMYMKLGLIVDVVVSARHPVEGESAP